MIDPEKPVLCPDPECGHAYRKHAPFGCFGGESICPCDNSPEDVARALLTAERANPRDEYHTMAELYEYRMLYHALAANLMPENAVKSWRHSDGEECFGGGWFVVYLNLPSGQVSNHYKAEHWDLFHVPEVERAPEWDGHTPADAADRLYQALRGDER